MMIIVEHRLSQRDLNDLRTALLTEEHRALTRALGMRVWIIYRAVKP